MILVRSQFEKCRKDNLTSIWGAEELYIPNHNQTEFMNILEKNLRPVYDAAKQQGYGLWERMNAYSAALQSASERGIEFAAKIIWSTIETDFSHGR